MAVVAYPLFLSVCFFLSLFLLSLSLSHSTVLSPPHQAHFVMARQPEDLAVLGLLARVYGVLAKMETQNARIETQNARVEYVLTKIPWYHPSQMPEAPSEAFGTESTTPAIAAAVTPQPPSPPPSTTTTSTTSTSITTTATTSTTEGAAAILASVRFCSPLPKAKREALIRRLSMIGSGDRLSDGDWHDIARMSYRQVKRLRKGLLVDDDRCLLQAILQLRKNAEE